MERAILFRIALDAVRKKENYIPTCGTRDIEKTDMRYLQFFAPNADTPRTRESTHPTTYNSNAQWPYRWAEINEHTAHMVVLLKGGAGEIGHAKKSDKAKLYKSGFL